MSLQTANVEAPDLRYRFPSSDWVRRQMRDGRYDTLQIARWLSERSGTIVTEADVWNILARTDGAS